MKLNAPESFYNLIKAKFTLNLNQDNDNSYNIYNKNDFQLYDLLKFSTELTELFLVQKN